MSKFRKLFVEIEMFCCRFGAELVETNEKNKKLSVNDYVFSSNFAYTCDYSMKYEVSLKYAFVSIIDGTPHY